MKKLYGKDIFDTAYSYVRGLLLKQRAVSVSVKTKTVSEDFDEDESRLFSETGEEKLLLKTEGSSSSSENESKTQNSSESSESTNTESILEEGKETVTDTDSETEVPVEGGIEFIYKVMHETESEVRGNITTYGDKETTVTASTEGSVSKSGETSSQNDSTKNSEGESETNITKGGTRVGNETVRESVETTLDEGAELAVRGELEERFPFILAAACCDLETLDAEYRRAKGLDSQEEFSSFFIGLDDPFPLSDAFAFPCAMYTCSMFLIDSDEDSSDAFFEKYSDHVSAISARLPFTSHSTVEKYPY